MSEYTTDDLRALADRFSTNPSASDALVWAADQIDALKAEVESCNSYWKKLYGDTLAERDAAGGAAGTMAAREGDKP